MTVAPLSSTPDSSRGRKEAKNMNLTIWLPAMFLLGLATFALMFAFVPACDKI